MLAPPPRACFARVIEADKTTTLIALTQSIERVRRCKHLRGVCLGILCRLITQSLRARVIPPASCICGDTPYRHEAHAVRLDTAVEEMHQVAMAEPGAQVPGLGRALETAADRSEERRVGKEC